ncbi:MAG: HAD hydrolase-like protein [Saprospiraceae bacterium]|nr:HAD hydrolase-like protein [Saprospiraceae bacterium]
MTNTSPALIVFDMAGTTVRDNHEVLHCFSEACRQAGLTADDKRLNALMGVSKLEVFQLLWREELGEDTDSGVIAVKSGETFRLFCSILEDYYRSHSVEPTEGALDVFNFLHDRGIKIALNTGFYRTVTDIILNKLGWLAGLDAQYVGGIGSQINFSITSDEVPMGRPEPYMIQKAMSVFGITDPGRVVKIGDTPVDLAEGRRAGVAYSIAVTNGTHTREELEVLDNDGLLGALSELPGWLQERGWPEQ